MTLLELLIVVAIMAVAVALVSWALPDSEAARLDEEAARLSALLEMARAESRVTGAVVRWVPHGEQTAAVDAEGRPVQFRFVGLPRTTTLPTRWLDPRISASVAGGAVLLGPEAILPPQRIVLRLADREVELVTDGLSPFAVAAAPGEATP